MKVELNLAGFVGRQFFEPSAVALVSTVSPEGVFNVAPKTQVMPIGRHNYWGFACCPAHHTYHNVLEQGEFVINLPGPELVSRVAAAAARTPEGLDEITAAGLTPWPSRLVAPPAVKECRVHLECRKHLVVEGLGGDVLIIGRVVAAAADRAGADPADLAESPVLAYVYPDHYAVIREVTRFSFPKDYKP